MVAGRYQATGIPAGTPFPEETGNVGLQTLNGNDSLRYNDVGRISTNTRIMKGVSFAENKVPPPAKLTESYEAFHDGKPQHVHFVLGPNRMTYWIKSSERTEYINIPGPLSGQPFGDNEPLKAKMTHLAAAVLYYARRTPRCVTITLVVLDDFAKDLAYSVAPHHMVRCAELINHILDRVTQFVTEDELRRRLIIFLVGPMPTGTLDDLQLCAKFTDTIFCCLAASERLHRVWPVVNFFHTAACLINIVETTEFDGPFPHAQFVVANNSIVRPSEQTEQKLLYMFLNALFMRCTQGSRAITLECRPQILQLNTMARFDLRYSLAHYRYTHQFPSVTFLSPRRFLRDLQLETVDSNSGRTPGVGGSNAVYPGPGTTQPGTGPSPRGAPSTHGNPDTQGMATSHRDRSPWIRHTPSNQAGGGITDAHHRAGSHTNNGDNNMVFQLQNPPHPTEQQQPGAGLGEWTRIWTPLQPTNQGWDPNPTPPASTPRGNNSQHQQRSNWGKNNGRNRKGRGGRGHRGGQGRGGR